MGVKEEKARQSCWCWTKTGRQLAPVKPTRCHKMFDESTAFSKRLTSCEQHIKALKKATDALLQVSEKTLSQPLPQVWDNDTEGSAIPVVGTGSPLITAGQLQRSHSLDMQHKVYDPIATWQKEYARMKTRMAELDRQSLRLDAARRAHYKGAQKHLKENVMKADNVSARGPKEEENPELTSARSSFIKIESEVHQELVQLADNARNAQAYLTKAMELQADTLSAAAATHAQPSFRNTSNVSAAGGAAPIGGAPTGTTGNLSAVPPPQGQAISA